ncbi:hypothetical protein AAVH_32185 [Aphelenchoides avenae]|nr:hypothetical protein AAVH_32185 [Aphelenchus avenae]
MRQAYQNDSCPVPSMSLNVDFCASSDSWWTYPAYEAGSYFNGTIPVFSKTLVNESIGYTCDDALAIRNKFNGIWYCYTQFTITSPSYATIANNKCASFQSGSEPVKTTDTREYGFLYNSHNDPYIGILLPAGATSSATAFTYYDGTATGTLNWASGRPNNSGGSNNLVIVNSDGTITDVSSTNMNALICRKPATSVGYAYLSNFAP